MLAISVVSRTYGPQKLWVVDPAIPGYFIQASLVQSMLGGSDNYKSGCNVNAIQ